ncbi:MAG: hypothetical protein HYX92_07650 [Chloroflexi bacterium]|nr:hypothetical protein [Chloroflexota bacterium]
MARSRSKKVRVSTDSFQAALDTIELYFKKGWTDGLPIVPPTEANVQAMLKGTKRQPNEVIGVVPPRMGIATVEAIAVNAVMAGCLPAYLPVIIASVQAMLDDKFNLNGVQGTTHAATPLAIVSGPVCKKLGINGRVNVFGSGFRANATIGRAIRLILYNIGGGVPDEGDQSSLGNPGKYSFCIAENTAESPWEPLHVERGLRARDSGVTMFACEAPHHIGGGLPACAEHLAAPGSSSTAGTQGEVLVVVGTLVAERLARYGWSKRDVKEYIYNTARGRPIGASKLGRDVAEPLQIVDVVQGVPDAGPKWIDTVDPTFLAPIVKDVDSIHVIVAGTRAWPWCAVLPGWSDYSFAVTKKIEG